MRSQVQVTALSSAIYNTAGTAIAPIVKLVVDGFIAVNSGGTFIPRFAQCQQLGTASTVKAGSYMHGCPAQLMSAEIHFPAERLAELAGLGAQFHAEGKLPGRFVPEVFEHTGAFLDAGVADIFVHEQDHHITGMLGPSSTLTPTTVRSWPPRCSGMWRLRRAAPACDCSATSRLGATSRRRPHHHGAPARADAPKPPPNSICARLPPGRNPLLEGGKPT